MVLCKVTASDNDSLAAAALSNVIAMEIKHCEKSRLFIKYTIVMLLPRIRGWSVLEFSESEFAPYECNQNPINGPALPTPLVWQT